MSLQAGQDKLFLVKQLRILQRGRRLALSRGGRGQQVSLSAQLLLFNYLGQFHGAPPAVQVLLPWEKPVLKTSSKSLLLNSRQQKDVVKIP